MKYIVNPTEARELALYFFGATKQQINRKDMAKTVNIAKQLLEKYLLSDLKEAVDYYTKTKPPDEKMYSLGYLHYNMVGFFNYKYKGVQDDINNIEIEPKIRGEEVGRNKKDIPARIREKYNFDMFEGNK